MIHKQKFLTDMSVAGLLRKISVKIYSAAIKPLSVDEDSRRQEIIFNTIVFSLFVVTIFLDLSVFYADVMHITKVGFSLGIFSSFLAFIFLILFISRKGRTVAASYLFIILYYFLTTYGIYRWGTALPIALLSYGAIIVITMLVLGTKKGFLFAVIIGTTFVTMGFLQAGHILNPDLSWRIGNLQFKDSIEDCFVFAMIVVVSWLSNREMEHSLKRAKKSEADLLKERDLLEIKVEKRTHELKRIELEKVSQLYRFIEFGKLASGIFHDLLNPLSVVSLSIEKIEKDHGKESATESIKRAIGASKRMESFIQTAKKQLNSKGKNSFFNPKDEINSAIEILSHKFNKNGVYIIKRDIEEDQIYGNSIKFFQVVVNLISNAIDSYENEKKEDKPVIISFSRKNDNYYLIIEDKGSGINENIQKKIFEPFFSTKDNSQNQSGFGLGLSTTRDIVEKDFHGKIEVQSSKETGTKFTIVIPQN